MLNDPEGHLPHGPRFGHDYGRPQDVAPEKFYTPLNEGQRQRAEEFSRRMERESDAIVPIDDFQAWCEMNWKEPHGTTASIMRSTTKLGEEVRELSEAVFLPSKNDLVGELGDVLWCTSAVASDLRINIKHGLVMLMDKYGHNIRSFEDGSTPAWVKAAQAIAFDDHLAADGIDEVIEAHYEPQEAAIALVDELPEVTQLEITTALSFIDINSRLLISIANMNYEENIYQTGAIQRAEVAEYLIARIFLDVAFLAKHAAGTTLAEVLKQNVMKLEHRVKKNIVDKADGRRE